MSVLWLSGSCPKIPQISDEELTQLLQKIKPVILDDEGLFFIEEVNPRNIAFTWEPKLAKQCTGLTELTRIETNHTCGYIGFFKPTIAEVLAQIPKHLLEEVDMFRTLSDDTVGCYAEGDGHRTVTILYKKEKAE
jgi:hypothetical protein